MRINGTKPNATGRSSGKLLGRLKKNMQPPKGEPWVWLTRELITSDAWRSQSITCRRLIEALYVDQMNHAGTQNGNLIATYDQMVEQGSSRRLIRFAVEEAEFLGLIRYERGGRWAETNQPSLYRLTFFADRDGNPPSNEWKKRTKIEIQEWKADRKKREKARKSYRKKQIAGSPLLTTVMH